MSLPLSNKKTFKVEKTPEDVLKLITNKLSEKNAILIEATPKKIIATMGSKFKSRFFGGAAVSSTTLPIKITFLIWRDNQGVEIELSIEDDFGFGSRWVIKGKYQKYFQSLIIEFTVLLF